MNKTENFILVKVADESEDIIERLNQSFELSEHRYYNLKLKDEENLQKENLEKLKEYKIAFLEFNKENKAVKKIYLGTCKIKKNAYKEHMSFSYIIRDIINSSLVIKNFISAIVFDLNKDFEQGSYVNVESAIEAYNQLEASKRKIYKLKYSDKSKKYREIPWEQNLNKLSQKNEYCIRAYDVKEKNSDNRSEFQIDRERLIHARTFRRLVDKAQIFTASKGDHYRTRMTHTLEVSQIARGICIELGLNNELTEAIALAHDIGHTPFGHQGERTLNNILRGKTDIIPNCEKLKMGGFKHNYQGLRVLSYLEEKYIQHEGINLSYQVLEGVLKHTKICELCKDDKKDCKCQEEKCFKIDEFLVNGEKEYLFLDYPFSTTLEGQIVAIADEIAQRSHDLDDALLSKHINLDELIQYCSIKKMSEIKEILDNIKYEIESKKKEGRIFIYEEDMIRSRIISDIITFFIKDVVKVSEKNMENYEPNDFFDKKHRIDKKLIDFSESGKIVLEYLERIINKKVINSYDVTRFDDNGEKIVTCLFKEYYNNIKILPDKTLKKIYKEIRKVSENVIDFREGKIDLVNDEIDKICKYDLKKNEKNIDVEEYILKRKIVVRIIVDHISGMTDRYAIDEYKRLLYV